MIVFKKPLPYSFSSFFPKDDEFDFICASLSLELNTEQLIHFLRFMKKIQSPIPQMFRNFSERKLFKILIMLSQNSSEIISTYASSIILKVISLNKDFANLAISDGIFDFVSEYFPQINHSYFHFALQLAVNLSKFSQFISQRIADLMLPKFLSISFDKEYFCSIISLYCNILMSGLQISCFISEFINLFDQMNTECRIKIISSIRIIVSQGKNFDEDFLHSVFQITQISLNSIENSLISNAIIIFGFFLKKNLVNNFPYFEKFLSFFDSNDQQIRINSIWFFGIYISFAPIIFRDQFDLFLEKIKIIYSYLSFQEKVNLSELVIKLIYASSEATFSSQSLDLFFDFILMTISEVENEVSLHVLQSLFLLYGKSSREKYKSFFQLNSLTTILNFLITSEDLQISSFSKQIFEYLN